MSGFGLKERNGQPCEVEIASRHFATQPQPHLQNFRPCDLTSCAGMVKISSLSLIKMIDSYLSCTAVYLRISFNILEVTGLAVCDMKPEAGIPTY